MEEVAPKERTDAAEETSVIGAGITITGNIEASVDLHVQGKVIGDVRCATLILGERSMIKGSVYADRVRAAGTVEGSIDTKDIVVESSARINGDLTYSRIRIANGGVVVGQMKHSPAEEEGTEGSKLRLVESERQPQATQAKAGAPAQAVYIE
jgi:cytoskeletal protein CcmA (bactofilin family)